MRQRELSGRWHLLAVVVAVGVLTGCAPAAHTVTEATTPAPPQRAPAVDTAASQRSEPPAPVGRTRPHRSLRVVLLGDSIAWTLGQGLREVDEAHRVDLVNHGVIGCGVTTLSPYRYAGQLHRRQPRCGGWQHRWHRDVRRARADVALVVVGRWEITDQRLRGRWTHIGVGAYDRYLRRRLIAAYRAASSAGAAVAFATTPYYRRGARPGGGPWPEDEPARADAFNRLLRGVVRDRMPHAEIVELGARVVGGRQHYTRTVRGVVMRYDGIHLTRAAGHLVAPWLYPQLRRAAGWSAARRVAVGEPSP